MIDAHHHFWRYTPHEFGWIDDSMAALRRDFLPADLTPLAEAAGVEGVVSVQARQTLDETRFLLDLAAEHALVRGVVGWVPLVDPQVGRHLDDFAPNPHFVGVRHVLQDEPDPAYMLGRQFNQGLTELTPRDLTYDILVFQKQLEAVLELVDRHPNQRFVLDHIAKPRIGGDGFDHWRHHMRELSRREHVSCKISGMVTEAPDRQWSKALLWPYFDTMVETFHPRRLMYGSDWPVCLVAAEYPRWFETVSELVAPLSSDERARVMGETAVEVYGLTS